MARHSPNLLKRCQMVQFPPSDIAYCNSGPNNGSCSGIGSDNREKETQHQSVYNAVRREPEAHTISTLEAYACYINTCIDLLDLDLRS